MVIYFTNEINTIVFQEKEHKKKCLLPDDGTGLPVARTSKPSASLANLDASVAAVKAQALDENVAEESQKVYAKPLPLDNQQQLSQYGAPRRQGRRFQKQQQQQQQKQQQRFAQQQQQQQRQPKSSQSQWQATHQGQFVNRGY